MDLLLTMEAVRKDTKRPNLFTNLRIMMLSRRPDNAMAFKTPLSFVNVRSERSAFVKVWRSFYSKATVQMMTQGAAAYDVPTIGRRGQSKAVGATVSGGGSEEGTAAVVDIIVINNPP